MHRELELDMMKDTATWIWHIVTQIHDELEEGLGKFTIQKPPYCPVNPRSLSQSALNDQVECVDTVLFKSFINLYLSTPI